MRRGHRDAAFASNFRFVNTAFGPLSRVAADRRRRGRQFDAQRGVAGVAFLALSISRSRTLDTSATTLPRAVHPIANPLPVKSALSPRVRTRPGSGRVTERAAGDMLSRLSARRPIDAPAQRHQRSPVGSVPLACSSTGRPPTKRGSVSSPGSRRTAGLGRSAGSTFGRLCLISRRSRPARSAPRPLGLRPTEPARWRPTRGESRAATTPTRPAATADARRPTRPRRQWRR